MRLNVLHLIPVLLSLLIPVMPVLGAEESDDYQPVKLKSPLEATIPANLKYLGVVNPRVEFRVIVDAEGEIMDSLAVSATHVGLLPKAEEKLAEARFEAARKDGDPTTGKITVVVTFYDPEQRAWKQGIGGAPLGSNVSEAVESKLYHADPDQFALKESNPKQLDEPLSMLESKLYRLHAPEEAPPSGQVVAEYYIDHNGKVRLPEIIRSDGEYLSMSVLMSLRETQFAPPTRDGHPTYVKVRQPFNFN